MNEAELLQAFRNDRSEKAFAELVRRYAALVYSTAKRRLANASLAEDVTQVVFIRFAKTPPDVKTPGELAAWLHRTTLNVTIDMWRSETRRRNREQQAAIMEIDTHSPWEEISPHLDEAVNRLEDEDRQAILLRYFREKSMRDIGAVLGVSEAAAKMRVGRAVERLRRQLGAGGIACTAAFLGTALSERSVEAAPVMFVSRLAGMRLPASAVKRGMFSALRSTGFKLATGVMALATVVVFTAHRTRSGNISAPTTSSQTATDNEDSPTVRAEGKALSADESSVARTSKPPKILFHVLDAESGAGLPQAKIHFVYYGIAGLQESHDTAADENGDAALAGPNDPAADSAPNVFVAAENHVPKYVSPVTNEYTIKLDRAITIGGLIVDESGKPISGVAIVVEVLRTTAREDDNLAFQHCPVTNHPDGSWSCSYIPRDYTNYINLTLKKPGYGVTTESIPLPPATANNLILVMQPGVTVTGKVSDEHDRPVSHARIGAVARDRNKNQSTQTDQDGVFTLTGVIGGGTFFSGTTVDTNAAGRLIIRPAKWPESLVQQFGAMSGVKSGHIVVQADGYAPQMKLVELSNAVNIVNFTLSGGHSFRGRVVDDLGNPIPNAVVQTDYDGAGERKFDWMTNTDANGRFEWNSAPAEELRYWFDADGYKTRHEESFVADGSDHRVVLQPK